jgi:hypothetical protein
MTASATSTARIETPHAQAKQEIYESVTRLSGWLERNDYRGYDTFDGLSSKFLHALTFNNKLLRIAVQQSVRRFPWNIRPLVGIGMHRSTKGMGFIARGFMRLHEATGEAIWRTKAETALDWLTRNQSQNYSGAAWGNHFEYQSRGDFHLPAGVPTVVWTSLIGHAYLDAYDAYGREEYLQIAASACEHIRRDLHLMPDGDTICISYTPIHQNKVHNANTLGAGLLARVYSHNKNESYRELARKAIAYTALYQRPDASWYYGEAPFLHWIDNFHTAYVLDSFKYYAEGTGDMQFQPKLLDGYHYWKKTFFLPDGTPRYYDRKTLPIDIQCSSQAIDTLVFFNDLDPGNLQLALNVANWTIKNMQDRTGYFYYRRYSNWLVNRTPTLHWGQATMLCSLAGLYKLL